jgi:ADP-heptose:LPS heptosyltransferase
VRILLVRLRLIGDVVFTTPAVRAVRRLQPNAHLTYLVESAAAPVVAGLPDLDRVLVVAHTRGWRRLRDDVALALSLRRQAFDLALDFHGGPRASWLTLASGARRRVGYAVAGRRWMYTDVVARSRELLPRHSVESQWDLVRAVFPAIGQPDPARDPVVMIESADARDRVSARLCAAGLSAADEMVVIHVSAGNPFRRWPADAFRALVVRLARGAANRRIILTSGPSETEAAIRIGQAARQQLGPDARAVVELGDLTLAELHSLVLRSALFVGGDSGPLHVAATTPTPIVGLFGPTLAERSAPWRSRAWVTESVDGGALPCRPCDQRRCLPGDFRCLAGLSPDTVADAAERALDRSARLAAG